MIAIDTNILIHAFRAGSPHHEASSRALNERVASERAVGVPWPCVHEFVAVVTNPRVFHQPSPPADALDAMMQLLAGGTVFALGETPSHLGTLTRLIARGGVRGPTVHDARIAAICLDHGVDELWTLDRDFSFFPELRTRNPLVH